jgi:hypothetical protein
MCEEVSHFHFGNWEEKEKAAKDIEMLIKDVKVIKLMTLIGVVSVLVSMASSVVASRLRVGVKALI